MFFLFLEKFNWGGRAVSRSSDAVFFGGFHLKARPAPIKGNGTENQVKKKQAAATRENFNWERNRMSGGRQRAVRPYTAKTAEQDATPVTMFIMDKIFCPGHRVRVASYHSPDVTRAPQFRGSEQSTPSAENFGNRCKPHAPQPVLSAGRLERKILRQNSASKPATRRRENPPGARQLLQNQFAVFIPGKPRANCTPGKPHSDHERPPPTIANANIPFPGSPLPPQILSDDVPFAARARAGP